MHVRHRRCQIHQPVVHAGGWCGCCWVDSETVLARAGQMEDKENRWDMLLMGMTLDALVESCFVFYCC